MNSYLFALRATLISSTVITMVACGSAKFSHSDKRGGAKEQTAGEYNQDCVLKLLGGKGPGQTPGQYPGQDGGYDHDKGGDDVVVIPPPDGKKGDEPPPPAPSYQPPTQQPPYQPPTQQPPYTPPGKDDGKPNPQPNPCDHPGQTPGQTPGDYPGQNPGQPCDNKAGCTPDDYYKPVPGNPGQYPTQMPPKPEECGKNGQYCDNGGPGQWPGQTTSGKPYDRSDIEACLGAFRQGGYDTKGQWGVDVVEYKSVSVLSNSGIVDTGYDHKIVIIKAVSVLGSMHFELMNPNALYCVKKNVAVLEDVWVSSCHQSNVMFYKDVNVLSRVNTRVMDCH